MKLAALGLPGAGLIRWAVSKTPLKDIKIPFRFGDIMLFVCEKTEDLVSTQEKPSATRARQVSHSQERKAEFAPQPTA
jgi:hypothetical protein